MLFVVDVYNKCLRRYSRIISSPLSSKKTC